MTMATIDAARALRWDHEIGSLETGKAADVVVVDAENTRLTPAWLTVDEPSLLDEAGQLGHKLGRVLGPRRYHPLPVEQAGAQV